MTARTVVYNRDTLYDQVWREPATKVAEKYEISSVALGKICRQLNVPVPGRGYWAKHAVGKAPPRPPLSPLPKNDEREKRVTRRRPDLDRDRMADSRAVGKTAMGPPIVVPRRLASPHTLVATAMNLLAEVPLRNGLACPTGHCLDVQVSPAARPRALRIMNALILALEERGLPVEVIQTATRRKFLADDASEGTRVLVGGEWIRFQIIEALVQFTPPMEKKPPKNLKGQELELWRYWNRPRTQLVASGTLILRVRERTGLRTSWRDTRRPIEEKLNAFVKQLFVIAYAKKQAREEQANWRKEFEDRQERSARRRARADRRERRVAFVEEQLERWRDARDLRALVGDVRAGRSGLPEPEPKWLAWATRYADEIDPSRTASAARGDRS